MTLRNDAAGCVSVTRVEFSLSDRGHPVVAAASPEDARATLEEFVPRGAGVYAEFLSVAGADPERVLAAAEDRGRGEARLLNRYERGALLEVVVGDSPVPFLGERGAVPREAYGVDGEGRVAAEIPAREDPTPSWTAFSTPTPTPNWPASGADRT